MKVGLAGFSGSGKSTVFHWLTGVAPDPAAASQRGQVGVARIPDERLDWLSAQFKPKKITPATIEFLDTPGLLPNERRDNPRRLALMRESDGLLVVLTGHGPGNLADEFRRFGQELLFADLEIVAKRIERLEEQGKKAKPAKEKEADQRELDLLRKLAAGFEREQFASELGLKPDDEWLVRSFQLLTLKPRVVLVNVDERRLGQPLPADLLALAPGALIAPVKLELELDELSPEDRQTFMQDLGIAGSVRGDILRAIYAGMGAIVFFTIGEDECRAWGLPKGADAVEGAGKIHTDLAKRFVRAEVVSYADYRRVGSMKEAKNQGVYRLEGKTYVVQDGDIMHIL
jgi:ribosome-binding ATPase YchF (GTP1/OBG family)